MAERPNFGALSAMIGDLKKAWSGMDEVQSRMLKVTGTAWSDDQTIKAVVGPRGHLLELEIDPRVFRHPNSKALAATIVATVRMAVEDAAEQSKEILDGSLAPDLRRLAPGGDQLQKMLHSHDADVLVKGNDDE
ncbi:YbaB/EbfC family nucleoid-associated protein [Micromonospora sp. NPDC005367]|uniref:YbaB/EbfC family nucleoid-associated protein n=1 Tax=Micromonospora sp. NPDC005367 TaxID=3155590 RepID=UPI0033A39B7D